LNEKEDKLKRSDEQTVSNPVGTWSFSKKRHSDKGKKTRGATGGNPNGEPESKELYREAKHFLERDAKVLRKSFMKKSEGGGDLKEQKAGKKEELGPELKLSGPQGAKGRDLTRS